MTRRGEDVVVVDTYNDNNLNDCLTLQHYMGHSSSKITERYAHAAQSEKLKRARGYSPIDRLGLKIRTWEP